MSPLTLVALAGLAMGGGAALAVSGASPARRPLRAALDRIGKPPPARMHSPSDVDQRLGALARRVDIVDELIDRLRVDLRLLGRTADEQAALLVVHVFLGVAWLPLVSTGGWLVGVGLPVAIPLWGGIAGGTLAGWRTIHAARQEAIERRATFSRALSSVCDLVAMGLASGHGLGSSLATACAAGDTWPFRELQAALSAAYLRGEAPWVALARLGEEAGLDDLVELASALQLSGDEGAAVRQTVTGKARSVRDRLTTDAERRAAATTERMGIPATFLLFGFVAFLGYPAIALLFQ